ncbi:hypothetical protein MYU51_018475 [Penicillium brevicompactum]
MVSVTYGDDDRHSYSAQSRADWEKTNNMGHNTISFEDANPNNLHLNLSDADLYLNTFASTSSFPVDATPDLRSELPSDLESHIFDCSNGPIQHCPTMDYPFDPFAVEPHPTPHLATPDSVLTPFPTPPPLEGVPSCRVQNRPLCILAATQALRSLHVQQTNCHTRQSNTNYDGHDPNGPEQPRMSGSVLKCNKDAGMSVCRMLQCPCALRPQNQLLLAIICSKLIAWYRAMIYTCFVDPRARQEARHNDTALEKVVHQPVTIGDHSVDDQGLGLAIQAQVTLGELHHMQRLVETLSARIQETASSFASAPFLGIEIQSPPVKLPELAHDHLITDLLTEVLAAKADLMTASQNP